MNEKNWYTVIGFVYDIDEDGRAKDFQKYYEYFLVEAPEEAIRQAEDAGFSVVGVLDGKHKPVDDGMFVNLIRSWL